MEVNFEKSTGRAKCRGRSDQCIASRDTDGWGRPKMTIPRDTPALRISGCAAGGGFDVWLCKACAIEFIIELNLEAAKQLGPSADWMKK